MVRRGAIDGQPIGALYKRARHSDKVSEHEPQTLRQVRFALFWEPIPAGRTIHFWSSKVAESGAVVPIPTADPKKLDITVIGCLSGRNGKGKRFRVDVIHGTGLGGMLKHRDFNALIDVIKRRLQEEFPEQNITGITRDVFDLEEKVRWDS